MACIGYEHKDRVELTASFQGIPRGAKGIIIDIHKFFHTALIEFDNYGRVDNVDCHLIKSTGSSSSSSSSPSNTPQTPPPPLATT